MNAIDLARQAPRFIIHSYARAARVPLHLAAGALRQPEQTWGPTLLLDRVEGVVETTVGAWLRDEELIGEGLERQERAAEAQQAAREAAEEQAKEEQREQEAQRQARLHEAKLAEKARRKAKKAGEGPSFQEVATAALAATTEDEVEAAVAPLD